MSNIEKIKQQRQQHFNAQNTFSSAVLKFNKAFPEFDNVRGTYGSNVYRIEWEVNGKEYSIKSVDASLLEQKVNKIIEQYDN